MNENEQPKFKTKEFTSWREGLKESTKQLRKLLDVVEDELDGVEKSFESISEVPFEEKHKALKDYLKIVELLKNYLRENNEVIKILNNERRN